MTTLGEVDKTPMELPTEKDLAAALGKPNETFEDAVTAIETMTKCDNRTARIALQAALKYLRGLILHALTLQIRKPYARL
jgi:hypothetical protein